MENILKTNKHTVCCLGEKQNQQTVFVLGWGSSDKKKRKEVFFVLLKQIPNLCLSVSLSFVHKIEFIF